MSTVIHIHPLDVYERIKHGERLQIVDVREDSEVEVGKIPGARHIPLGQLPDRLNELDAGRETVMVCRSGGRSAKACEFLTAHGFEKVRNMMGGMNAWSWDVE